MSRLNLRILAAAVAALALITCAGLAQAKDGDAESGRRSRGADEGPDHHADGHVSGRERNRSGAEGMMN